MIIGLSHLELANVIPPPTCRRLISYNLPFTTGNKFLLTLEIKNGRRRSCLLAVRVLHGRKVEELDKAISVAAKDPAWYGINEAELEKRKRWTSTARTQADNVRKAILARKSGSANRMRQELMRLPDSKQTGGFNQYAAQDNEGFISSESDRQLLLIKQQDEELDELSASITTFGHVGLTIHDELVAQERIIDGLGMDMESTTNRLDFVQKKMGMVMKKAGAKGQMMMILFLVVLFIILFVLVFLT